ncbi:MAG: DUF11 domain-containing protein [Deltaproteobacteria bacterium]|nr:DUF11 domain-containing protein [Deltaproteobacteria bacterium]
MQTRKLMAMATAIFLIAVFATSAYAVGTPSGTSVANRATVNYAVGGIGQTAIESSPTGNATAGAGNGTNTTFLVDTKLNLTVAATDVAAVQVTPGSVNQVLTYTVTNTGNATQDVLLSTLDAAGHEPFALTDNFNAGNVRIFAESGATPGFQAAQDTATYIDELVSTGASSTRTVYVVSDISLARVNDDVSAIDLVAQVAVGGGVGVQGAAIATDDATNPDVPGTVQTVFADADGPNDNLHDGIHSAPDAYQVVTALLTITKTSAVVWDPINLAANPKAIPGARVEYTVSIANTGAASATNVVVSDSLATEIGNGTLAFYTDGYGAAQGIEVTAPNLYGGAATALTNAGSDDEGDFGVTTANTVTVTGITVASGQTATVTFMVEVQ